MKKGGRKNLLSLSLFFIFLHFCFSSIFFSLFSFLHFSQTFHDPKGALRFIVPVLLLFLLDFVFHKALHTYYIISPSFNPNFLTILALIMNPNIIFPFHPCICGFAKWWSPFFIDFADSLSQFFFFFLIGNDKGIY